MLRSVAVVFGILTAACGTTAVADETGDGTDGTDSTGASETTGEPAGPFARGITLVDIRANQGAAVPLWLDGAAVGPGDRVAPLVHGRTTMFRAVYELAPDWEPRPINARIHILAPDGTEQVGESVLMIDGPPDLRTPDGTFRWIIPPELAVPPAEYFVELFEVDAPYIDDPAAEDLPRYPAEGSQVVGFEGRDATLNVVLVPIRHVLNGCDQTPPMDAAFLETVENKLLETHPVQTVNLSVHPVGIEQMSGSNSLGTGLALLSNLYTTDAPGEDVLYYGVADPCDSTNGVVCTSTFGENVGIGSLPDDFIETLPRCLDRSYGMPGVDCPNDSQPGADPNYPYADGKIGTYGFSVVDQSLKQPELHYSYQAGCLPRWYSDYEWARQLQLLASP